MLAGLFAIGSWLISGPLIAITLGALVGATIGGLTAAVMGGDIGKGMLYGAIGGAVTGGLGYAFSGATAVAETGQAATGALRGAPIATAEGAELAFGVGEGITTGIGETVIPATQSWSQKLAASFTSEEAVGKMAGGLLQGVGGAMGQIGAAETAAEAMEGQSEDALALQRMRGEQALEEIGATGREVMARTRDEIEGRQAEARIPFEERRIREENIARNLGMLTTGVQV